MAKLTGITSLERRKKNTKSEKPERKMVNKITTVGTRRNITTGLTPITMRLSENDKDKLNIWLEELSFESGRQVSNAKLLRGLINMKEKINSKKLIKSIIESF